MKNVTRLAPPAQMVMLRSQVNILCPSLSMKKEPDPLEIRFSPSKPTY